MKNTTPNEDVLLNYTQNEATSSIAQVPNCSASENRLAAGLQVLVRNMLYTLYIHIKIQLHCVYLNYFFETFIFHCSFLAKCIACRNFPIHLGLHLDYTLYTSIVIYVFFCCCLNCARVWCISWTKAGKENANTQSEYIYVYCVCV